MPNSVPSDLQIAQAAQLKPIQQIAADFGLADDEIDPYGRYVGKISLGVLERLQDRPNGKYIDVTAITPTPLGEGKTLTTVGLGQALGYIGKRGCIALRQPSMGPVFGIKGGAAGGGYSQVVPMEQFNLHGAGDFHAVTAAHNLLAAAIDASRFHGNPLNIELADVTWPRVLDVNDRALRDIIVGIGGKQNGIPRETRFDITSASEVMAILALSDGLMDMRRKLGDIVIGLNRSGKAVTARELQVHGAMTVILKDALRPNLYQTLEGTPAIVHAGPFGNIAHGNNSILADKIALKLADYVVTESGFAADLGMEKFMNIKCRYSGLTPDTVVLVATVRALKMHGGAGRVVAGKPLPKELVEENIPALKAGSVNLLKHIENARRYGVPVVVAVNRFTQDTDKEIDFLRGLAQDAGAEGAFVSDVWARGGAGGAELAEAIVAACEKPKNFQFLYPLDIPIKDKIAAIATQMYGAANVSYEPDAERAIKRYTELGFDKLPICMAKSHLSISHEPTWKGAPSGYTLPVREVRASVGAGFLVPLCGEMMTMPGLGSKPAYMNIDIDEQGNTVGLF
ncbi:MAG: formate--tetrahydrofolate ligase [Anaerolineae bacterium]|nr:formate--tetrahydrofolate ligase [Anaerolineae bacterium]